MEYQEGCILDFGPICEESLPHNGQDRAELAFGLLGLRRRDILVAQYDAFAALVGEDVPAPIHEDAGLFFGAIEQGEMHAQPGQPGQVSRHGAAGRQLDHCRTASYLRHHALVEIIERLRLLPIQQAFDRFTDVTSGLESGGAEPRQHLPGFAVGHGRDVADGEDSRVAFHLKVRPDRNAATMHQALPPAS